MVVVVVVVVVVAVVVAPGKIFMSKTSKKLVFISIFVPLEEKRWYLRCFCSIKDNRMRRKHSVLQ